MATNAFISYAHADANALERLHKHLAVLKREGNLTTWSDHAILPGATVDRAISAELDGSQIFLALISPDYLASAYCYEKEFERAQALAAAGRLVIVPVILEDCDWRSSPFGQLLALPKDGHAIAGFTNPNNAYLDVVNGLRRILDASGRGRGAAAADGNVASAGSGRRPRIKQDFDSIQRAEYADQAFAVIREYFRQACCELARIGDDLRAKFEDMDATAFTCTVVNRAKRSGGEADITVHNCKSRSSGFGDISYVHQRHAARNSSNGSIRVEHDEYQMFLSMDQFGMSLSREQAKTTPQQAAERLWGEFVQRAGIEYE